MSQVVAPKSTSAPPVISTGNQEFTFDEASAFYEEIRGKSQVLRGNSNAAYILVKEDLKRLSKRLLEIIAPYVVTRDTTKIFVDFVNESGETFTGIEQFLAFDYAIPARTARVNIDLAFLIKNAIQNSVHEFKIDLYLESGVNVCEVEHNLGHNLDELPFRFSSARYSISFQNYTLARNCATAIDEWLNSLPVVESNSLQNFLYEKRRFIKYLAHFIFLFLSTFIALQATKGLSYVIKLEPIEVTAFTISVLLFCNLLSRRLSERVQASIRRLRGHSYIDFTSGDKTAFNWYTKHRKNSMLLIGLGIGGAILLNVVGGVITDLLPTRR